MLIDVLFYVKNEFIFERMWNSFYGSPISSFSGRFLALLEIYGIAYW